MRWISTLVLCLILSGCASTGNQAGPRKLPVEVTNLYRSHVTVWLEPEHRRLGRVDINQKEVLYAPRLSPDAYFRVCEGGTGSTRCTRTDRENIYYASYVVLHIFPTSRLTAISYPVY